MFGFRARWPKSKTENVPQQFGPPKLSHRNRNSSQSKHRSAPQAWPHRCCWTLVSLILLSPDWPDWRGMGSWERTGNPVDTYVVKAGKITSAHVVGNHPHRLIPRNSPSSHTLHSLSVVSPRAEIRLRLSLQDHGVNLGRRSRGRKSV